MSVKADEPVLDIDAFEASLAEGQKQRALYRSDSRRHREMSCPGHSSDQDIRDIWALQEGKCYFCLEPFGHPGEAGSFVKDHLIPLAELDGSHWPHNIALTCAACNTDKHARSERGYWVILKSRIPAERWSALRERAKNIRKRKLPLTVRRKKDRERGLQELERAIQARAEAKLSALAPRVFVTEGALGSEITIEFGYVTLTLPGVRGGSDSASRWLSKYGDAVVGAIIVLDDLNPTRRF